MKKKIYTPVVMCMLCGAIITASIQGEHVEHLPHSQYNQQPINDIQVVGTASLPSGYPGTINT